MELTSFSDIENCKPKQTGKIFFIKPTSSKKKPFKKAGTVFFISRPKSKLLTVKQ